MATAPQKRKESFHSDELIGRKGGQIDISAGDNVQGQSVNVSSGSAYVSRNIQQAGGTFFGIDNLDDEITVPLSPSDVERIFAPVDRDLAQVPDELRGYAESLLTGLKYEALQGAQADRANIESGIRSLAFRVQPLYKSLYIALTDPAVSHRLNPGFLISLQNYAQL